MVFESLMGWFGLVVSEQFVCMGVWSFDVWMYGVVVFRVLGFVDLWICGSQDLWGCEILDF